MESHYKDSLSAAIVNMLIQCGFENASNRALDELVGIGIDYIKNLALKVADLTDESNLPNPDALIGLCSFKVHGMDMEKLFLFLQNYCDIFPPQPKVYYGPVPLSIAQKNTTEPKPPEIVSWAPDIEPALATIGLKFEDNEIVKDPNFDHSKIWKSYQSPKTESDINENMEICSFNSETKLGYKYGAVCKYELPTEALPTKYEPPTIDFDSSGNLIGVNGKLGKLPDAYISDMDEQDFLRRKSQFADRHDNKNSSLSTPNLFNGFRQRNDTKKSVDDLQLREKSEEDLDDSALVQPSRPASNQHLSELENDTNPSPIVDRPLTTTASDEAWNAALQAKIEPIGTFSKQIEKSLENNTLSTINHCDTNEKISISNTQSRKRSKRHRLSSSRSRKKRKIYSPIEQNKNDTINSLNNHQPDENTYPSNTIREEHFNESTVDSNYSVPYSQHTPTKLYNRDLNNAANVSRHNSDDNYATPNYRDDDKHDRYNRNVSTNNHYRDRDLVESHDNEHIDMVESIVKSKSKKKSHRKSSYTNKRKKKKPQKLVEIQASSIYYPEPSVNQNPRLVNPYDDDDDDDDNDDVNNNIVERQHANLSPGSDITEPMRDSDDGIADTLMRNDFGDTDVNDDYSRHLSNHPKLQDINTELSNHNNDSSRYNHEKIVYSGHQSHHSDQSAHHYNQSNEQHVYRTLPSEERLSPSPPNNYPYYSSQNKSIHHTESIHAPESIYDEGINTNIDSDDAGSNMRLKIKIKPKKHHKHKHNHRYNNTHTPSEIGGRATSSRLSSDDNVNINDDDDEEYERNSLSERLEQIHYQSSPLSFKNNNNNIHVNNLSPPGDFSPQYDHRSHARSYNYNDSSPVNHHSNETPQYNHNYTNETNRFRHKYHSPSNNSSPVPPNTNIYENEVSQSPVISQEHHLPMDYNDYSNKSLQKSSKKKNKSSKKSKSKKQKHSSSAHKSIISVADVFSEEEDKNHKHLNHKKKKSNQYSHSTHPDVRQNADSDILHNHRSLESPITHSPYQNNSASALPLRISKSALSNSKSKNKHSSIPPSVAVDNLTDLSTNQSQFNSIAAPSIIDPGPQLTLSQLKFCCNPGQAYYTTGEGALVYICPVCALEDNGSLMVCCDNCQDWYHGLCLQIYSAPPEDQEWYCPRCADFKSKPSLYKASTNVSSSRHHSSTSNKKSKSKSTHSKSRSKK